MVGGQLRFPGLSRLLIVWLQLDVSGFASFWHAAGTGTPLDANYRQ
jgi:hypothetical protein